MHQHLQNLTMRFIRKQNVYQMKIKGQPPAVPLPPPENKVLYILGMMVAVSNPFIYGPYFLGGVSGIGVVYPWMSRDSIGSTSLSSNKPPLAATGLEVNFPATSFGLRNLCEWKTKMGWCFLGMQKSGWCVQKSPKQLGCIKPWKIIANKCK